MTSIRETRATIRSAYTLARIEDDAELRAGVIDALERHHEACINALYGALEMLETEDVRTQVLRVAAALMPKGNPPLRLVEAAYEGTDVP